MAQQNIKPSFSIVMLGATEHGKTAVAEAPVQRCSGRGGSANNLGAKEYTFETPQRRYFIRDGKAHAGVLRGLIFGPSKPDAAIAVVRATSGPTPELIEQLRLVRKLSIKNFLVVLSSASAVEEDLLDLVEQELRELLVSEGFPGDETPFLRGDFPAPNQVTDYLLEKLDSFLPSPQNRIDDFLLLIEERFGRPNQDPIAAGHVLRGSIKVGDPVSLVHSEGTFNSRVSAIDVAVRFQKEDSITAVGVIREKRERAKQGQWISCHLSKINYRELSDSYALARPGSLRSYKEAQALLWIEQPNVSPDSLLFRIRAEQGGFRRFFPATGPLKITHQTVQEIKIPPISLTHLEVPAYFEVVAAPSIRMVVGCGVIISLL